MKGSIRVGLLVVVLLMAPSSPAIGHQDPVGDTYPTVEVIEGSFVVTYWNEAQEFTYTRTYSASGKELEPPTRKSAMTRDDLLNSILREYVVETDDLRVRRFSGSRERPSVERLASSGEWTRVDLPWGRMKVDDVTDVLIEDRAITFLVTTRRDLELHLVRFEGDPPRMSGHAKLGIPTRIYSFPVASGIAKTPEGYAVAWIAEPDVGRARSPSCGGFELHLGEWRPISNVMKSTPLRSDVDWNAEMAIAAIGSDVLIAFHQGSGEYCLQDAVVEVEHADVDIDIDVDSK